MAQCRKCQCPLMAGTGFDPACMDAQFIPAKVLRPLPCPSCGCRRNHGAKEDYVIDRNKYRKEGQESFLKAANVKGQSVKITITGFREATLPSGLTPIVDIKPIDGRNAFPLNMTNLDALVERLGEDEEKWAGKTIKLVKVRVRNPKSGKIVDSLGVS